MRPYESVDVYESDLDIGPEEQIQYDVMDDDNPPMNAYGMAVEEFPNVGFDVRAYEDMLDQARELDNRNWELQLKCQEYHQKLRISKRSIPQKIKDRIHHWKKVASNLAKTTKKWANKIRGKPTDDLYRRAKPRYRDLLAERYYSPTLHQE